MDALVPITDPLSEWGWVRAHCELPRLGERVSKGEVGVYRITGTDAALVLAVNQTKDSGIRALWVLSLGGAVAWRPKANLRLMGMVLNDCEAIARSSECKAIRIEPGDRLGWKLKLLPRFGFARLTIGAVTVMQKDVT